MGDPERIPEGPYPSRTGGTPRRGAHQGLASTSMLSPACSRGPPNAGRPLHGLRHSFLHDRMPARQHHPRVERLWFVRAKWEDAYNRLSTTNNFPEVTGRICPALCEKACVLGIHQPPTMIKLDEQTIIDQAWGLDYRQAHAAAASDRPDRRRRRLRPRRPCRRPAAHPRRPHRRRLRDATTPSAV